MRSFLTAALAVVIASPALADGPLVVESGMLAARKLAAADGSTRIELVPATKVVPGDRVVLTLSYRNTGAQSLGNVVLDNPLPRGIAYRAAAAGSPAPELSVDGKTYGPLATLRVAANGGQRAATADDVTHVRWRLAAIAPAARGRLAVEGVLK